MKTKLLLGLLIFLGINSFAQDRRTCGMEAYMQEKMQDPTFRAQYEDQQSYFNQILNTLETDPTSPRAVRNTIPVAVHFPAGNEADRACLEALAQNQVDILNDDFRGENADISNWTAASTYFPGVNTGSVDVSFEIATLNHPSSSGFSDGDKAVTIGSQSGSYASQDTNSTWSGYMNLIVKYAGDGILGYSPLGGTPSNGGGVVIRQESFGAGSGCAGYVPQAPYNLGRTLTHELGHFLNLNHTWGSGGCSSDDDVTDTPNISDPTFGNPANGSVSMCGNTSLTMNYMDYVNDQSMYMITQGQKVRVGAYIRTIENQFNSNTLSVDKQVFKTSFSITPNPTSNEFTLKTLNNTLDNNSKIQIFDILGKKILSSELNNNLSEQTINVSNLKNGLYIVKIVSGTNSTTKKIVIQK